uniref:CSON014758 protein n=1 Tax=Culicoides sonorensis TaxID=179676 RepID=A0A336MBV1_CULSO
MNFKLPIHHQYYRSSRGKNIVKKYKKIKIKDGKMNANVVSRSKVLLRIDLSRFGLPTLASCHQNNLTSWHHRKIRCYCTTDTKIPEKNSPSLGQTPPSTNTLNDNKLVEELTFLGHHLLMDHTHVVVDGNNCTEEVDIMFPYSLLPVLTKTRGADSEIAVLPDSVCCGLICCVE